MDRRNFLKQSCTACLSLTAVSTLLVGCTATQYLPGTLSLNGVTVLKDDFKIKQKESTAYSSFIIVRNDSLKYPICVFRKNEEEYSALWMQCSHQGAELLASGDVLQCSAHGSEFNSKGEVVTGPANNNLRSFPVTVNKNEIFIDLRKQS